MTGKQPKLLCYLNKVKRVTWINDRPPVSVISVVAKAFETIVYNQLPNYLSENNIPSKKTIWLSFLSFDRYSFIRNHR